MRIAVLLLALCVTRAANAQEAEPTSAPSPPTARFELVPPDEEVPPVADESRSAPHTVPNDQWVPISNSTYYGGGFDRPWSNERTVERSWYGWQTLVPDTAFIVMLGSAMNGDADQTGGIGLLGYVLGGPIIHAAHGHWGKSLGSLGIRISAPIVGALVGAEMADCERSDEGYEDDHRCGAGGAIGGLLVGATAGAIFDAAVIANEDVEPETPTKAEGRVTLRPDVRISHDRAQLSLAGSF